MHDTPSVPGLTIYKASAGSGKTFTLAATYIAHLIAGKDLTESPHRRQLAVTFTNKATAEMKQRILQHLYALSHPQLAAAESGFRTEVRHNLERYYGLDEAHLNDAELSRRAGVVLHDIIHDYDHFQVTTIDKFFQRLLAGLAHEMGLSTTFKVELGDKEVITKAVDRLLAELGENSRELEWITEYIDERMENDRTWREVAEDLSSLGQQLMREQYMMGKGALHRLADSEAGIEGFDLTKETVDIYKRTLRALRKSMEAQITETAIRADEAIRQSLGYAGIYRGTSVLETGLQKLINFQEISKACPTEGFRKYTDGRTDLLKKADRAKGHLDEEAETIRKHLEEVVNTYDTAIFTINSCKISEAQLNPLTLLDTIDQKVEELNKETDRVMLASTPLLFHNLSKDTEASFVFERAGTQYDHVMIDEFQDTSRLQWSNLKHLLVENMAHGNSCMLVGDVKQGIYRFRGGDWTALASFREDRDGRSGTYINIETLKTNYRSGRHIVEFNNRIFLAASHVADSTLAGAWGLASTEDLPDDLQMRTIFPNPDPNGEVTQEPHHEGGFVRIETYEKGHGKVADDEFENDKTASTSTYCLEASVVREMLRLYDAGVTFSDMAILIRSKKDAKKLLDYFDRHHGQLSPHPIPLVSEEAFELQASQAVQTIVHTLRHIVIPDDSIAEAYVMAHLPKGHEDEIRAQLAEWRRDRYGGLPFYELTTRIISLFDLEHCMEQSAYLYKFLDAVLQYIDDNTADIRSFLKYWEESLKTTCIPTAEAGGVSIITIHKSKGLAFHSVFMPYCDWKIESSSGQHQPLVWVQPKVSPFDAIPFLPIRLSKAADDSIYRDVYRHEVFAEYAENLNLLYVAFTRARQNLLVWCNTKEIGIGPLLQNAILEAGYSFGNEHTDYSENDLADHEENTEGETEADTTEEKVKVIEIGHPSALYATTKASINSNETEDAPPSLNPLDFTPASLRLDYEQRAPQLTFRQSNNARFFLNPTENDETLDDYRLKGILLHELMSSIERVEEADDRIESYAREGRLPPSIPAERLKLLLHKRLRHPLAQAWFDGSWQLFRECAILYRGEDGRIVNRRPDRVMIRDSEAVVIDFKFGRPRAEHADQVLEYMTLLRRQRFLEVRGYLWYLYSGNIEEVVFPEQFSKKT